MEFKAYHKIRQFKDVVMDIQHVSDYKGKDENGEPIYEKSERPTLTFTGTVKLHGTNAQISYTPEEGILAGRRTSLLNPEILNDHMEFNRFVMVTNKDYLTELLSEIYNLNCKEGEQVILYGEWVGKGIQKGVAITQLNKSFFVFDCKIYSPETDSYRWLDINGWKFTPYNMYNITDFPTYKIDIDFDNPQLAQERLMELTMEVERECPVSKQLGFIGMGEGIVWKTEWNGERRIFKTKGEKHRMTKPKGAKIPIAPEVLQSIKEFVDYACTENRIEQGIQETNATLKSDMGKLCKWIANDIISEEDDVLTANNLEWKQVAADINTRTRNYFFDKLDNQWKEL